MNETEVVTGEASLKPAVQDQENQMLYVVAPPEGQEASTSDGQPATIVQNEVSEASLKPAGQDEMLYVVAPPEASTSDGQPTTVVQMEEGSTQEQAQEILLKLDPRMEETLSQVEEGSTIIILNAPEDGNEDHHNLNVMAEAVTSAAALEENAASGSVGYSASTPQLQNVKRTYPKKIGRPETYDFTDAEPTNRNGELYLTPAISVGDPEDEKFPEYIKVDDDTLTKDDLPDYVTVVGLSGKRSKFLLSDDKYWDGKLVYVRVKEAMDQS